MKNSNLRTKLFMIIIFIICIANVQSGEIKKSSIQYDAKVSKKAQKVIVSLDKNHYDKTMSKSFYGSHLSNNDPEPRADLVRELNIGRIRVGGNSHDIFNWKLSKSYFDGYGFYDVLSYEDIKHLFDDYESEGILQVNLLGYMPDYEDGRLRLVKRDDEDFAAEMVTYLNGDLGLGIKNICLGNEFAQWHDTHPYVWQNDDAISADEYIERYIRFSVALKQAQYDVSGNANDIKIWGPEMSASYKDWQTGNMETDCEYTDVYGEIECSYGDGEFTHFLPYFLSRLKDAESDKSVNPNQFKLLDYFSIHYYPNFRTDIDDPHSVLEDENGKQRVLDIMQATQVLHNENYVNTIDISSYRNTTSNILPRMHDWVSNYYPDVKLVLTEFAVDSSDKAHSYHPMIRPLYMADSIGIFATNGFDFFNRFMMNASEESNLPWVLIENNQRTDLYQMYKLFTNNFLGDLLKTEDDFGDWVNTYASKNSDTTNVFVVNKSPNPQEFDLIIRDEKSNENKVATYEIKGWSTAVLKVDNNIKTKKSNIDILEFGAKEMDVHIENYYKNRAP